MGRNRSIVAILAVVAVVAVALALVCSSSHEGAIGKARAANAAREEAHLEWKRGNLAEAERLYTTAVELDSDDPMCRVWRGMVRTRLGRKQEAIDDFASALPLVQDDVHAITRGGVMALMEEARR